VKWMRMLSQLTTMVVGGLRLDEGVFKLRDGNREFSFSGNSSKAYVGRGRQWKLKVEGEPG
jgi:hypothetical protein